MPILGEGEHCTLLREIEDRADFHTRRVAFQTLINPVVIGVEDYGHEVGCCPSFGALLHELEKVAPVLVVADQMRAIYNEYQRALAVNVRPATLRETDAIFDHTLCILPLRFGVSVFFSDAPKRSFRVG